MEFFVCPCTATGSVVLDGNDQGPNRDDTGTLLTKVCGEGKHTVSLKFGDGKFCFPAQADVEITGTDPD
jgi:hypothetical protein